MLPESMSVLETDRKTTRERMDDAYKRVIAFYLRAGRAEEAEKYQAKLPALPEDG